MDAEAIMGRVLRTPRDLPTLYAQHAQDPLGPLGGFNQEASAVKGIEEMVRNAQLRKYDRGLRARNLAMVVTAVLGLAGISGVVHSLAKDHDVGARTALGIRRPPPDKAGTRADQWRCGLHHYCFRAKNRETVDEVHALVKSLGGTIVHAPEDGPWAPGYYSVLFEDPDGIRGEVNHVPGKGVLAEGAQFRKA